MGFITLSCRCLQGNLLVGAEMDEREPFRRASELAAPSPYYIFLRETQQMGFQIGRRDQVWGASFRSLCANSSAPNRPVGNGGFPVPFAATEALQEPAALLRGGKRSLRAVRGRPLRFQATRVDLLYTYLSSGAFASDLARGYGQNLAGPLVHAAYDTRVLLQASCCCCLILRGPSQSRPCDEIRAMDTFCSLWRRICEGFSTGSLHGPGSTSGPKPLWQIEDLGLKLKISAGRRMKVDVHVLNLLQENHGCELAPSHSFTHQGLRWVCQGACSIPRLPRCQAFSQPVRILERKSLRGVGERKEQPTSVHRQQA